MRKSIKLYEINTALHKGFILCIRLFIMEAFVVIENVRHRRCTLTPFTVARWHGIFWDTPKWEPNKRGRVVEWQVIACNTESRCPLFRPFAFHILLSPYFGYVFPRRYKTRQLPVNPEFRTVSFEFDLKKLYSLLFLAKTPLSTKRWVWDLIGVEFVLFFIVLGPEVVYILGSCPIWESR